MPTINSRFCSLIFRLIVAFYSSEKEREKNNTDFFLSYFVHVKQYVHLTTVTHQYEGAFARKMSIHTMETVLTAKKNRILMVEHCSLICARWIHLLSRKKEVIKWKRDFGMWIIVCIFYVMPLNRWMSVSIEFLLWFWSCEILFYYS